MKDFIKPLEIIAILISLMIIPHLLPKSDIPDFMQGTISVQNIYGSVKDLEVEFAITQEEKEFGLMYRRSLHDIDGMFFIYKTPQIAKLWMKNTYIPLDMIFIREDGVVLKVSRNVVPLSKGIVSCAEPVTAVLEVRAGYANNLGIKKGSVVFHEIFNNMGR